MLSCDFALDSSIHDKAPNRAPTSSSTFGTWGLFIYERRDGWVLPCSHGPTSGGRVVSRLVNSMIATAVSSALTVGLDA